MATLLYLSLEPGQQDALLALNNQHAEQLSALNADAFRHLVRQAFHAARIGDADVFLISLDQDADYQSPDFWWFQERHDRFVYIDRIVVAASARNRGLARLLYADLFERVGAAGHDRVVCEVNVKPPNPTSDALHASLGFIKVGRTVIDGERKTVRQLERHV